MRVLLMSAACVVFAASAGATSGNLLKNAGFEDSDTELAEWTEADTSVFRVARSEGVDGSNALVWESADGKGHTAPNQSVRLEPGKHYRYSMKVRHEGLDGKVRNSAGVELFLMGYDADGKHVCGRYAHGMRGTSDGWYEVYELVYDVPTNVARAVFGVTVASGLTGKAWFDDLKVEEYVPPVVEGLYASAYRNCAWNNRKVTFAAALNVPADAFCGAKAWLCFTDRWGNRRKFAADSFDRETATFEVATTKFAEGGNVLRFVLEGASGEELGTAELVFTMLAKRPKEWRAWFDENQVLRVNGRKVFPIGASFSGKGGRELWQRFLSSGINFMQSYSQLSRDQLDDCASNGVHVIYGGGVCSIYAGDRNAMMKGVRTLEEQRAYITNRVMRVIGHPAVIGWYLNDETRPILTEKMKDQQRFFEKLDPSRFTYSVWDHPEYMRGYLDCCDVFAMDPYPIGRWPIGQVLDWSERMRRGAIAARPYWICAQDFDWSWFRMGKSMPSPHMPSFAELSSMVWQAIVAGAKGVELYGPGHFFDPERLNSAERNFADMVALVADVRRASPALLSSETPVAVDGVPAQLRTRTWRLGADSYLLVVNPEEKPARASLRLSERFDLGFVEAGDGLSLKDGNVVDVSFGPIGYGLLHLAEKAPRVFLAGDSLLAKSDIEGRGSWGEELRPKLAKSCELVNFARGGTSTRTFRNMGWWDEIMCRGKKGDWVIISFGHNDSSLHRRDRGVLISDYKANLVRFVREARKKGMRPVLVTSVATCTFDASGEYVDARNLRSYAAAMREVAGELAVPLVDLHGLTEARIRQLGDEKAKGSFMVSIDGKDRTHTCATGARWIADLFVGSAVRLGLTFLSEAVRSEYPITAYGAKGEGVETAAIQKAIDAAAAAGGGVVSVPSGTFVSGALFFKPGTALRLRKGAVLKASTDVADFPDTLTRIEGETRRYTPALVNADGVDGFFIEGEGELDGSGLVYWKRLVERRKRDASVDSTDEPRPRLVYVSRSRQVRLQDVTIRNSAFWSTHFYRCEDVMLTGLKIFTEVLEGVSGQHPDAVDIDGGRRFRIEGCRMDVPNDAITLKGGKGPTAHDPMASPESASVEDVIVSGCSFGSQCTGCMTLGSECFDARNIVLKDCRVESVKTILRLKMRPDTRQRYESVLVEDVAGTADHALIVAPYLLHARPEWKSLHLPSMASNVVVRVGDALQCRRSLSRIVESDDYRLFDVSCARTTD